jgi:hypothetical protein
MFGVLRPAAAGSRGAVARLGLAALLACIGVSLTAGASSAFATNGTVKITKVNQGGDPADVFHFDAAAPHSRYATTWAGAFDLKGAGAPTATTKSFTVHANTGSYYTSYGAYDFSERADAGYELKSVVCKVDGYSAPNSNGSWTVAGTGVSVKVGIDHTVACTFTNQRKTGTIKVVKDLEPATDAGRFDLKVDGKPVATQVGDGGYGTTTVATGTHTVGEYGANLADYARYTKCLKGTYVVAEGSGDVNVPVGQYDDIVCTIKNVRKAKLVVAKTTVPADTATPKTAFSFTESPNGAAFDLIDGASDTRSVEPGKAYTITEADAHALGYKLTDVHCSNGTAGDTTSRSVTVTPAAGETLTCSFTNTKLQPGIKIVKSGPATAYSGDTLDFGFDVSNTGERGLHDVQVTDDHCAPVTGPVTKAGGNADDILDPGETWHFTCSYVATNVMNVDPNPVTNIAHVQARDDQDTKVEDEDSHDTLFFHPAIDIEKSGPATATAGALLTYTLDVTDPGDTAFAAADVAVTDAKCKAAPALQSTNGDTTPDVLNPGDHWTYTCQVQTAAGQTSVVNVADVQGTDEHAKVVTDEDTFTTTLTQPTPPSNPTPPSTPVAPVVTPAAAPAPAQQVAGVTQTSRPARGTAALRGPRVCPTTRSVKASVSGRQIRRVTFFVRGHKVKTVTKADRNGRFTLTLRTASLRRGANSVTARVEFTAASQTRTRNLRITITRCAQAVRPQFTG